MTTSLITGATGFIGAVLAERLRARGERVLALVRATSKTRALIELGVEPRVGNMLDTDSLRDAMAGADVIYHLASLLKMPWKPAFISTNVDGCGNVARAAAEQPTPPRLVLVSSMAAAGPAPPSGPRRETDPPQPVSLYGRVKLAGERAALRYAEQMPTSVVRPPMVFGPGDRPSLPLFRAAARGLRLSPPGANQIAMIHVADLADMLIAVAERGERVTQNANAAELGGNGSSNAAELGGNGSSNATELGGNGSSNATELGGNGSSNATELGDAHAANEAELGDARSSNAANGIYQVAHALQPSNAELGRLLAEACGREEPRTVPVPRAVLMAAAGASELWGRLRDRPAHLNLDKLKELTAESWGISVDKMRDQLGFQPAALRSRLAETARWYRDHGWIH